MRIVSGKYRGKKLQEFELSSTRPTTDRVKESIFNLIQFNVVNSVVLDLFSGTGALGIEAISRGAKKVYLIDNNDEAVKIIKSNLKGIEGNYIVNKQDYKTFLKACNEKFDIVFLDPPYKTELGVDAISLIIKLNLLNENGIIIFETSADNEFNLEYENYTIQKKKYGKIIVFKMVKN